MYYGAISAAARHFEAPALERLAGLLSRLRYTGNGTRNDTYLGHLKRIFPESDDARLRRILREYWRVHQRAFLGLFYAERFTAENIGEFFTCDSLDVLDDAVSAGRGVILLVPHFGDERTLHIILAALGYGMHVISSRYEGAPQVLRNARLSVSMKWHNVAFPDQPIGWLYEALGRGEVVQISPTAYGGPRGHWVWSFGVPVLASSTPVRIARSTGCRLVVGFNHVLAGMKYRLEFQEFDPGSLDASTTAEIFRRFQDYGMQYPAQYNWMNLVIRHRESNTISRIGEIPRREIALEERTVDEDWDPNRIPLVQSLLSASSGAESAL